MRTNLLLSVSGFSLLRLSSTLSSQLRVVFFALSRVNCEKRGTVIGQQYSRKLTLSQLPPQLFLWNISQRTKILTDTRTSQPWNFIFSSNQSISGRFTRKVFEFKTIRRASFLYNIRSTIFGHSTSFYLLFFGILLRKTLLTLWGGTIVTFDLLVYI